MLPELEKKQLWQSRPKTSDCSFFVLSQGGVYESKMYSFHSSDEELFLSNICFNYMFIYNIMKRCIRTSETRTINRLKNMYTMVHKFGVSKIF